MRGSVKGDAANPAHLRVCRDTWRPLATAEERVLGYLCFNCAIGKKIREIRSVSNLTQGQDAFD